MSKAVSSAACALVAMLVVGGCTGTASTGNDHQESVKAPRVSTPSTTVANDATASTLWLEQPIVRLQARSGAIGGNPIQIDMRGTTSIYVKAVSPTPLSMTLPVGMNEPPIVFASVGLVPKGKIFRIERITFFGMAGGDSNGHGEVHVRVGETDIVNVKDRKIPFRDVWTGRIDITPGREQNVSLTVANSSLADVLLEGTFIDASESR